MLSFFALPKIGVGEAYAPYGEYKLIQFEENGKIGLRTCDGHVLIEPICDYISPRFIDGVAKFEQDGKTGYYNEKGEVVSEAVWKNGANFSEGLAAVTDDDGHIGFINNEGILTIPNRWIECPYQCYSNGLALVMGNDEHYYINKNGEIQFTLPLHVEGTQFENGYALTRYDTGKNYYFTIIDKFGEELNSFHSDMYDVEISEGFIMWMNKNTVYCMKIGVKIIFSKSNTLEVRPISKGHALLKMKEKQWKCFDTTGTSLFTIKRDAIIDRYFGDYILAFDFNQPNMYYYDHHGKLIKKLYEGGQPSCERISYRDRDTGKYGYMDMNFHIVIPPRWQIVYDYINNYARVASEDGTAFLMDLTGEIVAKDQ